VSTVLTPATILSALVPKEGQASKVILDELSVTNIQKKLCGNCTIRKYSLQIKR
jgi:hypothetical protein